MPLDPRTPVLVGLGEAVRRPGDEPAEPAALMAEAVQAAVADAGGRAGALLRRAAIGAVPSAAWPDGDPGRRVAALLGLDPAASPTLRTSMQGGNGPQLLVNVLAQRIADGALDVAVVTGAEALHTVARHLKAGEAPPWPAADGDRRAGEVLEEDRPAGTDAEAAVGLIAPIMAYPLIENAIRAAAGRTPAEHLRLISELWSRFSAVAETQPAAWSPRMRTAQELATPSPQNRQVTLPYTKLLNSNIQVDQGAALLLCSAGAADAAGIARDRWVFPHAGARATDEWFLSQRRELHRSPAIRACGRAVLAHACATADDLGPIDLYSCFPAAVQLAATELGLPLDRPGGLTCTGGLTSFGGPGNDYATHGIVAVARRLREEGGLGLATALGWYATKHALGLYGSAPPATPFAALEPALDPVEPRTVAEPGEHDAIAETCTVIYDRDGTPSYGILFALLPDGRRALGRTGDPEVLHTLPGDNVLGGPVRLHADRSFALG